MSVVRWSECQQIDKVRRRGCQPAPTQLADRLRNGCDIKDRRETMIIRVRHLLGGKQEYLPQLSSRVRNTAPVPESYGLGRSATTGTKSHSSSKSRGGGSPRLNTRQPVTEPPVKVKDARHKQPKKPSTLVMIIMFIIFFQCSPVRVLT